MKRNDEKILENELEGFPIASLESSVEKWIFKKTGREINFNSHEATEILINLKLISRLDDKLFCLSVPKTLLQLPVKSTFDMFEKQENEGFDEDSKEDKPKKQILKWFK